MSRIASVFRPDYKALIAYLTVGYPDVRTIRKAAVTLANSGVDIIELGIPFSDPLADGATIQKASYQALQQGVTPRVCLEVAKQLHQQVATPLVFMTYYNPVFHFGLQPFCQSCAEAGISGLIVPDLPPDIFAGTHQHRGTNCAGRGQVPRFYLPGFAHRGYRSQADVTIRNGRFRQKSAAKGKPASLYWLRGI